MQAVQVVKLTEGAGEIRLSSEGSNPVVFVGKIAHGSYHSSNNSVLSKGALGCRYFADYRNPSKDSFMRTSKNLVNLKSLKQEWALVDKKGNFIWGPANGTRNEGGVSTNPNQQINYPSYEMRACKGSSIDATGTSTSGCYKSECLSGDVEELNSCQKECKSGYTNLGMFCKKSGWFSISSYRVKHYDYDYRLPTTDVGLLRRRNQDIEWNLP